jgi:hypothetical protein
MPWVGFEPTITASERTKTVHALDRSATVTGALIHYYYPYFIFVKNLLLSKNSDEINITHLSSKFRTIFTSVIATYKQYFVHNV